MKRDIDLARQLLFDIEARGSECSFGTLNGATNGEAVRSTANGSTLNGYDSEPLHGYASEAVRYHLRLLIDAGFVKEVERTTAGVLCVRLTNAGHELLELSRSDLRWRDAKACCLDTTGGLSLTVLRAILTKWAVESSSTGPRYGAHYYRRRASYRPLYYHRVEPRRRYESGRYLEEDYPLQDDEYRYVRTRPTADYRESWTRPAVDRFAYERTLDRDYVVRDAATYDIDPAEPTVDVSLPVSLI